MRSTAILEILNGIDGLDVDESAKRKFRQLACSIGKAHGYKAIDRAERVSFACRLLQARVSRPSIRDRLIAYYDISPKQAYRTITAAMKLGHKSPPNDTNTKEN